MDCLVRSSGLDQVSQSANKGDAGPRNEQVHALVINHHKPTLSKDVSTVDVRERERERELVSSVIERESKFFHISTIC